MLHAKQRSNIYQFDSLWFDPIGTPGEHANYYTIDTLYCGHANYSKCRYDKIVTLDIQFCAPNYNFKEVK
jgi:hypothetical protein